MKRENIAPLIFGTFLFGSCLIAIIGTSKINRDADILTRDLVEFNQRKDLIPIEKGKMKLKLKDKLIEILNVNGKTFIFEDSKIKKITNKIEDSSIEEVDKEISSQKEKEFVEFNPKIFDILKKEFGDFEIII